jgi:hypothetical protein
MDKIKLPTAYQEFIHKSRYARWIDGEGRRETWVETVDRYLNYMCDKQCAGKVPAEVKAELRAAILNLEVMPSMRCMMTAGKALDIDGVAGYNCAYVAIDNQSAFDEMLYILMCVAPDTMIKTKNGNKRICDITTKDEVMSYNNIGKQYEYVHPSLVSETPSSNKRKIELKMENGHVFRVTEDHKFLTTNRGFVEACDLTQEDEIANYHEIQ